MTEVVGEWLGRVFIDREDRWRREELEEDLLLFDDRGYCRPDILIGVVTRFVG